MGRYLVTFALVAAMTSACGTRSRDSAVGHPGVQASMAQSAAETAAPAPVSRLEGMSLKVSPMPDGDRALETWLATIRTAKRTIGLETFIFRNDPVGEAVGNALLDAADRGIRVRILLDDFFYRWENGDLSWLDAHPNVDLRIFNPHSRILPVPVEYLLRFRGINRRMHNKMLIVDGERAIIGGRNISDEYFLQDPEQYFSDFDILIQGTDVRKFGVIFDRYWNDGVSDPVSRHHGTRDRDVSRLSTQSEPEAGKTEPFQGPIPGAGPTFPVAATFHADSPDGEPRTGAAGSGEVEWAFLSALAGARKEIVIVTPYFIPGPTGLKLLTSLAARGVAITIVTNSHASTNHPSAHAGYMRYRRKLLSAGVRLFEYRGDAIRLFRMDTEQHRAPVVMHSKFAVIDRRISLIGSPNFDPRSLRQNTEILMRLESPDLARWLLRRHEHEVASYCFELHLGDDGALEWTYRDGGLVKRMTSEPSGSLKDELVTTFFGIFPFDEQL